MINTMVNFGILNFRTDVALAELTGGESSALPNALLVAGKSSNKKLNDPLSTIGVDLQKQKPPPAALNSGLKKAAEIANPTPKRDPRYDAIQVTKQKEAYGQLFDQKFGTKVITLAGDRQVRLRARNNGVLLIDFPNETDPRKRVSLPVPGVNRNTSTSQQIQQAVQKLCNDNRSVPYVYDRGNRPIYNWGNPTPTVKESFDEKYVAQREAYAASIRDFPPVVKELAGVTGGVWFETLGKLGIGAEELIDTMQGVAKQITASPAAWKAFIDTNFSGNDLDARLYRQLLGSGVPRGGAGDGKTTAALVMALDRNFGIQARKLTTAVGTDPVGVGRKLLGGLKQMAEQALSDLDPKKNSDPFVALGTLLAKVVFGALPLAKGGIDGAKWLKSAVRTNAPKLLETMGKASFEGAVASVQRADAKLLALANKAKLPGGLSAAEKVQQTALTGQLKSSAKAASQNDAKGLHDASAALNKTLQKEVSEATPTPKNGINANSSKMPHPNGRKFLENSKFVTEGQAPATFAEGRIWMLDIGDRLFNSPLEADAALARFIAGKPEGEYAIRILKVQHGDPILTKYLVSIEPSELKHQVTSATQVRQTKRLIDWSIANRAPMNQTRFDHNHSLPFDNAVKSTIPSGVQNAQENGDAQYFIYRSAYKKIDHKFAIWGQDSKTVVKLEFTVKALPLDKSLRELSAIEDRALFSKLFNDCFDVKLQKFDHRGNKIGHSVPFDVMGAISKERRVNAAIASATGAMFTGIGLYGAKKWLDNKDKK